jgi:hypothetical protein
MDSRWSWVFAGVVALGVLAFVGLPLATGLTASFERRDDQAAVVDGGKQRSDRDGAKERPGRGNAFGRPPWAGKGNGNRDLDALNPRQLRRQLLRQLGCWPPRACPGLRQQLGDRLWPWSQGGQREKKDKGPKASPVPQASPEPGASAAPSASPSPATSPSPAAG